ncbi:MAG: hypothetical protein A2992_04520 [Elusimicrobia bacterium RIFCSPLOWO2_01_FULL_59_12]|nr:MAG: hypothetical protein A2992_04520 [Elusimicrobia bacterium RIFCSPLOWO2_01_FULL_59_12]
MHGTYLIEVAHKPGITDPLAAEVLDDLKHAGLPAGQAGARGTFKLATSKLYRLIGRLSPQERARVGGELLSDPVVEEAHEGGWKPATLQARPRRTSGGPKEKPGNRKAPKAKSVVVDIWFKPGVTDSVGESVLKGLRDMNLEEIQDVRTGMRYRFIGLKDPKVAEKLALAVLINPLIHDRTTHVD